MFSKKQGKDFRFSESLLAVDYFFLFLPTMYPHPPYPDVKNLLIVVAMKFIAAADTRAIALPAGMSR